MALGLEQSLLMIDSNPIGIGLEYQSLGLVNQQYNLILNMYYPSFYVYYLPNDHPDVDTNPSSPKSSISSEIEAAQAELEKLRRQNIERTNLLKKLREQNEQLSTEQARLTMESQRDQFKESSQRRPYKRRRTLDKKFSCQIEGCTVKFSSKMAVHNHERNKHHIMRRPVKVEHDWVS